MGTWPSLASAVLPEPFRAIAQDCSQPPSPWSRFYWAPGAVPSSPRSLLRAPVARLASTVLPEPFRVPAGWPRVPSPPMSRFYGAPGAVPRRRRDRIPTPRVAVSLLRCSRSGSEQPLPLGGRQVAVVSLLRGSRSRSEENTASSRCREITSLASTGLPEPFRAGACGPQPRDSGCLASTGLPEPFRVLKKMPEYIPPALSRFYGAPGAVPRATRSAEP